MGSSKGQQLEKMLDDLISDAATYRDNPLYKPSKIVNLLPKGYRPHISDDKATPREKVVDILQEIILHRLVDQLTTGKKHNVSIGYFYLLHKYFYTEKISLLIRSSKEGLFTLCLESAEMQSEFLANHLLPLAEKKSVNKGIIRSNFTKMIEDSKVRKGRTQYNNYDRVLEGLAEELAFAIPDLFTGQTKITDANAEADDGKNEYPKNGLKSGEGNTTIDVSEKAKQTRQDETKTKGDTPKKEELAETLRKLLEYELGLTEYLPRAFQFKFPIRGFIERDIRIDQGEKNIYEGASNGFGKKYLEHGGVIVGPRGSGKTSVIYSLMNSLLAHTPGNEMDHVCVYLTAMQVLQAKQGEIEIDEFLVKTLATEKHDTLEFKQNLRELFQRLNDANKIIYFVDDLEKMTAENTAVIQGRMNFKRLVYYTASPYNYQMVLEKMSAKDNLIISLHPLDDRAVGLFIEKYCPGKGEFIDINRKTIHSRLSELSDYSTLPIGVVACCSEIEYRYGPVSEIIRSIISTLLGRMGAGKINWFTQVDKSDPITAGILDISKSMMNALENEVGYPSNPPITCVNQLPWQSNYLDENKPEYIPLQCSGMFTKGGTHWGNQLYLCTSKDLFCFLVSQAMSLPYMERTIPIRYDTPKNLTVALKHINYLYGLQWELQNERRLPHEMTLFSEKEYL
jgi:hypothetical protein